MSENVLYTAQNETGEIENESVEDDVWDDTLLIKAYDRAVLLTKEKVSPDIPIKIASRNEADKDDEDCFAKTLARSWKVGACCRSIYSEDGIEYEAVIKNLNTHSGTCWVKYIGYNNEEEVAITSLNPSQGKEAQTKQKAQARLSGETRSSHPNGYREEYIGATYSQTLPGMIPPPPPPFVLANLPKDETDALSAMLMAWYMSGFHTGYYQGLTKSKTSSQSYGYHSNP